MRFVHLLQLTIALTLGSSLGATPTTPTELAHAIQTAILAHDTTTLHTLICTDKMPPKEIEKLRFQFDSRMNGKGQLSVSPDRLPTDISFVQIYQGFRIEPNLTPIGIIRIAWQEGRTSTVNTLTYGKSAQGYLLTGYTRTDLGWKGPPDHQIGFSLEGFPTGVHLVVVKYNASGVDIEERYSSTSAVFLGQYIDEIKVSGITADFQGKLVVRDLSKPIFESPALSGITTFTYRRHQP